MQTHQQLEATLRDLMPLLAARFHVRRLGYFGSFATGQAGPNSDVDILAEFSEPLGWDFFELEELLEQALNRKVDLVTPAALKQQLREGILAQVRYI
ncbi:nucleotidyltransferase family protein [Hymenobacter sp. ISL-91]|uniref:nucleotidyltransferase family protein n=1 Tax=Hymenobacter sp. ISL-91 TaxID=2819151 RepID=UPI001BE6228B|nr:nucleotidyltransferase family protein [Hymenobacter sp. ISL-91]MBT2558757.1 nucleotidyltransferase family protein [Hymenobacter sp. ISL-91]